MDLLRFVVFSLLLLISQNQDSEVVINDGTTDGSLEKDNLVENPKPDLPDLEIVSPKATTKNSIWRSLLITFPVLVFTLNQLWGYFAPSIVSEFSKLFKNRYAIYFSNSLAIQNGRKIEPLAVPPPETAKNGQEGTEPEDANNTASETIIKNGGAEETQKPNLDQPGSKIKDLVFTEKDNHHIAFYEGFNRVMGYIIDIECLNRQDIFFCVWNKIHEYTDNIEITAFVKTDEQFSVYIGRKSHFCKNEIFKDLKTICCEHQSLVSKNLPKYMIYSSECHNLANILSNRLFETIGKNIEIFNYLCISDIFQTKLESETFKKLDSRGFIVKISLNLTHQRLWGYEFNDLQDLLKEFSCLVKNVSTFCLPKESKAQIKKSRQQLIEQKEKDEHSKRQELAMKKKDGKVRALKEKMMAETDNEKQIKLKEKFDRLEAKEKIKKCSKGKSVMVIS